MKLVIVTNSDWFFLSHRLPIALAAIERGDKVWLLTKDTGRKDEIESKGINFINIPFERSGTNPFHEMKCVYLLWKAYRRIKPDVIHHVTIKSVLLGSLAARMACFSHVVNAISGMGYVFTAGRRGILQTLMKNVMCFVLKKNSYAFILQNPDDQDFIRRMHLVPDSQVFLIKGSGVNLTEYAYVPPIQKEKLQVLFPARILKDKGVLEFISAAHNLRSLYEDRVLFILAGNCDVENPSVLKESDLSKMLVPGYLEWIGFQKKMKDIYANSDIVCLPSYREGLPKSLIEACAVGRPIVTTDVPGCKECVINKFNGILVPPKQVLPIEEALKSLLNNSVLRLEYGKNSRALAEKNFSIKDVVKSHLYIYDFLLGT